MANVGVPSRNGFMSKVLRYEAALQSSDIGNLKP